MNLRNPVLGCCMSPPACSNWSFSCYLKNISMLELCSTSKSCIHLRIYTISKHCGPISASNWEHAVTEIRFCAPQSQPTHTEQRVSFSDLWEGNHWGGWTGIHLGKCRKVSHRFAVYGTYHRLSAQYNSQMDILFSCTLMKGKFLWDGKEFWSNLTTHLN